jgi:hypothetical protein
LFRNRPKQSPLPKPPVLRGQWNREWPVFCANVKGHSPVRFSDEPVHLLVLLYESLAITLVFLLVARGGQLLAPSHDARDGLFIMGLDCYEHGTTCCSLGGKVICIGSWAKHNGTKAISNAAQPAGRVVMRRSLWTASSLLYALCMLVFLMSVVLEFLRQR